MLTKRWSFFGLALGALGVVYGDIGTSPLYAVNQVFFGHAGVTATPAHVYGAVSLIFWLLTLVLTGKYLIFVLRADYEGEGGVFALLGLLYRALPGKALAVVSLLLIAGASLLFGDGMITPAISVLSAVEGLKVATPAFEPWIIPLTVLIVAGLFWFQRYGTHKVGKVYGPVMVCWFIAIAALGIAQIIRRPDIILAALNPWHAIAFLKLIGIKSAMAVMGAVFLVLTGGEALYADLGHFGRKAIRVGWFTLVYPALFLNYLGQGAFLLRGAEVREGNIFFSLVPAPLLYPMVGLATAAAVIASVAMIFGVYSLVAQAIALGVFPRMNIIHTSFSQRGQIYLPVVNWVLCLGCVALVFVFGSASGLAGAYGLAVSGVMLILSVCMVAVAIAWWRWRPVIAVLLFGAFALLDAVFVASNSLKFTEGGFIPLAVGAALFAIMYAWRWGRRLVAASYGAFVSAKDMRWLLDLKRRVAAAGGMLKGDRRRQFVECDRAAVFMVARPVASLDDRVPITLRIFLKRNGAVPRNVIILTLVQEKVPYVPEKERYRIADLGALMYAVQARFGFMEQPDAVVVLRELKRRGVIAERYNYCSIESGEEQLMVGAGVTWWMRLRVSFFRLLLRVSFPAFRYLGVTDEVGSGLSKIIVPVRIARGGVMVELPEFALTSGGETVDPDTLKPASNHFVEVN